MARGGGRNDGVLKRCRPCGFGDKTGLPVFRVAASTDSRRVRFIQPVQCKAVAFAQHIIHFMQGAQSPAGRRAGAHRRQAHGPERTLALQQHIAPRLPAGKPKRLTGRLFRALRKARSRLNSWAASTGSPGDECSRISNAAPKSLSKLNRGRALLSKASGEKCLSGSSRQKAGVRKAPAAENAGSPSGAGRAAGGLKTRPRAAMTISRRMADSAGRRTSITAL